MRGAAIILAGWLVAGAAGAQGGGHGMHDYMRLYSVQGSFEDVRDDLELAITGRGIKINNIAYIGRMLARTAREVGATRQVFVEAQAFEFCSATVSRATMEANPHNIVFCPYVIAVYVLPEEPDRVYIAYRRPELVGDAASRRALAAVDKLLADIVAEVVQ